MIRKNAFIVITHYIDQFIGRLKAIKNIVRFSYLKGREMLVISLF